VQGRPAPAQAADPAARRRDGERDEQDERRESHRDVRPLGHVLQHVPQRVALEEQALIEHDPGEEVQRGVGERQQADGAAEPDDAVPSGQSPDGSHGEGAEEQADRPVAGAVGDLLDRVRAEVVSQQVGDDQRRRHERGRDDGGLRDPSSPSSIGPSPFPLPPSRHQ